MNEISKNGWHKEEPLDNVKATHPTCLRKAYYSLAKLALISTVTLNNVLCCSSSKDPLCREQAPQFPVSF